ncbi:hypothetical protein [Sandarakinorhabdus rubra]|uniref:hypothetical protein n=1 Tax=Sandarakinorhabdus rubra TaxID=2672568 RepID=UPI0013DB697A|nr:hypothetical protein [Sandarakinorhabdus rubra]
MILPICLILATIGLPGLGAQAQPAALVTASPDRLASFADVAELTLASPVIVRATITRAAALSRKAAPDVAPGRARLLVTVAVSNPLLAPAALPASLVFAWDAPLDSRGKPPKVTGMEVLAFLAAPGAGGATRLISRRAVQPWDEALADTVRRVAREARSSDVPDVRGVTSGFRDVGTVAGESESQFFLATTDDRPAVLVVQNRPGEARRVAVARGDIIDESAQPVQPGTLLWYRLACSLPARLPAAAGGNDPALARDWQTAIASLGPCGLTG